MEEKICPKCLGSKEAIRRVNNGVFISKPCNYCELDNEGKPSGIIHEPNNEEEYYENEY